MYKDLVKHTYDKIFLENLHFLRTNFVNIQSIVLKNQKLINNKAEKALFIYELAEKIKVEKINEAIRQKAEYGQVLMNNFNEIEKLYNWLNTNNKQIEETSIIWIKEETDLEKLSNYLFENSFTETPSDFYDIIIDPNTQKINWLKTKTLLIYLFECLKKTGYISKDFLENSFIEDSFLLNGKVIENVKQSKSGKNQNKNAKPKSHILIDTFFDTI